MGRPGVYREEKWAKVIDKGCLQVCVVLQLSSGKPNCCTICRIPLSLYSYCCKSTYHCPQTRHGIQYTTLPFNVFFHLHAFLYSANILSKHIFFHYHSLNIPIFHSCLPLWLCLDNLSCFFCINSFLLWYHSYMTWRRLNNLSWKIIRETSKG